MEEITQEVRDHMGPGFLDTWQMCLVKKDDRRACKVKAIAEGADLKKPFPLEFVSHPGLAMIKGDDIHSIGAYMLIGESTSDKVMKFTVEAGGGGADETEEQTKVREAFNKALSDAKTPEERVELADRITEHGYKNTGQLIMVPKDDGRALVFDEIKDGKFPEGNWKMTLKSHPGRAIVRGGKNLVKHDGEQAFLGDAKDAHTVKMDKNGKYIHSVDKSNFWLEIPRDQHEEGKAMWFRTKHSNNDSYFAWVANENGTVSSKNEKDLVLGYGISPASDHWNDLANSYGWKKFKTIKGFEDPTTIEKKEEPEELGKCLKLHGEDDRWIEIPYGEPVEYNFAWLRTHHGGGPHFNYTFNKDGTISPEDEADLVWGLADPTPCSKWKDVIANHIDWKLKRADKMKADAEKEEKMRNLMNKVIDEKFAGLQKIIEEQGQMIKDLQSQISKLG